MRLETVLIQTRKKEADLQSDYDFIAKQYRKELSKSEEVTEALKKYKEHVTKIVEDKSTFCLECMQASTFLELKALLKVKELDLDYILNKDEIIQKEKNDFTKQLDKILGT